MVMPSADLEAAASTAVKARTINNGQSCIAAKRFIVHEKIADAFEKRFVEKMAALKIGDPLDPSVEIGPLATPAIREEVDGSREEDRGRRRPRGSAAAAFRTAPATSIRRPCSRTCPRAARPTRRRSSARSRASSASASLDEAIAVANRTRFGLGSSAWTKDASERDRFVRELEAGSVFINGMVKSDPRLPFGGVKKSGHGRELSEHGIREFVNIKTVWEA